MLQLHREVFRHTHDHQYKRTKLLLKLDDHVVREWAWVHGILTLKQVMKMHDFPDDPAQLNTPKPVKYNPCALSV